MDSHLKEQSFEQSFKDTHPKLAHRMRVLFGGLGLRNIKRNIKDTQSKASVSAGGFLFLVKCSKHSYMEN
ncbi:hypothetical protein AC626_00880 [Pseudoalteromonas rubra]|uniref:Uncharacterized protein n=1 Tax=Pseudoalteromonas rubra TaxID=43658 RepID=A0A0L0EXE6_9GAMM|nr:hypothetical protein AC626_00880 [Pseudoalteromonas rubra]